MEIGPSPTVIITCAKYGERRVQCASGSESIARFTRQRGSGPGETVLQVFFHSNGESLNYFK